ncbi:MAG: peptide chain release factor N(5)-glutamine methyltransferase [Anaerolineales bacterium]
MITEAGTGTIAALLAAVRSRLAATSETASLDAQVLLAHALGVDRGWLLAHPEAALDAEQLAAFEAGLARLEKGEPLPYILGEWEFFGLKLKVTPAVLIPRPETELLVETALAWLAAHPTKRQAADVGTGSGCIPIALTANCADLQITAGDISPAALAVARGNVGLYTLQDRVHLIESDLLAKMQGPFDLITANLPYIPEGRLAELTITKWEPRVALGGGKDGLRFIEPFLAQAAAKLASGGLLLAEIDASLEAEVLLFASKRWPQARIEVRTDLAELPRLLVVET